MNSTHSLKKLSHSLAAARQWITLRPDLAVRIRRSKLKGEGVVVQAFNRHAKRARVLWTSNYFPQSGPDLTKYGLNRKEHGVIDKAVQAYAPELPLWKNGFISEGSSDVEHHG